MAFTEINLPGRQPGFPGSGRAMQLAIRRALADECTNGMGPGVPRSLRTAGRAGSCRRHSFTFFCAAITLRLENSPVSEQLFDSLVDFQVQVAARHQFLLGLYQGVSMMERGAGHVANDIDRIFLYRRPILDYWCESGEDLPHIVRHVLIHEIGHHFGLSDDDMEAIEAKAEEDAKKKGAKGANDVNDANKV